MTTFQLQHTLPLNAPPAGPAEEGDTELRQQWDAHADHSSGAARGCELSLTATDHNTSY